jgi:serine/threonine-protein kinase
MTDPARLTAALADRYRIERELGQGGMATVYLAQDLKHDRKVAVKVLRPELAAVIGAERFLSEIKTTANLQHPHILPLFDSGAADSFLFYVMPYVEGESLRDRLTREKQLPIADVVRIASEVASALDYAHRHNVIHRDIKPENILLHDGRALVADFGIALAASKAGGSRMTETGMSLGTPAYMSPEQAMGERELDARSDVYALGCVTYEMLTGEPPFTGPTAQAIVAKVMTAEPVDATSLRKTIPPHLADAVHTALQKLPADRFASAAELGAALEGKTTGTRATGHRGVARSPLSPRSRPAILAAGALLALLALAAGWVLRGGRAPRASAGPVEFTIRLGDGGRDRPYIAISADGRRILQAVQDSTGTDHVAMRELGSTAVTTIAGTGGARDPIFSPDGNWIAFIKNGGVYKVPASGGPAALVVDAVNSVGCGWGLDGATLMYTRSNLGLWRVSSAGGGTPERLTSLDTVRKEFAHWYPQALPGGRAAIFISYATPLARSRIEVVEFATGRRTVLVEGAVFGRYVASGHLLYGRDGAVFAVPFDPASFKVTGTAVPVIDDVAWTPFDGLAGYAISDNGTLVYLKASEWAVERRVTWVDRAGHEQPALPDPGSWAEPRLSPDGRWIALTQTQPKRDIWLFAAGRHLLTQLTHAPGAAFNAAWMPDSRSIIYTFEDPVYDLHRLPIDASGPDTLVIASSYDKRAGSIARDGRTLAYTESQDRDRLTLVRLARGSPTADHGQTNQNNPAISPDGHWLAYQEASADEQPQVYVRALDGRGGRIQVSAHGGSQPRWTKGGREIVFRNGDAVLASAFQPATGDAGAPTLLFRKADAGQLDAGRSVGYDVTPDGSRFLMIIPIARPEVRPAHVILNWFSVLAAKVKP